MQVKLATTSDPDVEFVLDSSVKMAFETEGKILNPDVTRKQIRACIENPKVGCYYISFNSYEPEKYLGTLMITYEMSLEQGGLIHWI